MTSLDLALNFALRRCGSWAFGFLVATSGLSGALWAQGPFATPIVKGNVRVELNPVATNLTAPHYLTHANDNSGRLFVVDQTGDILLLKNESLQPTPYFSVPNLIGLTPSYDERGLLGLAFHPDFALSGSAGYGKFYTNTSEAVSGTADFSFTPSPGLIANHQGVIREWTVDPSLDTITSPISSRELIRVDQPQSNHNGGALNFGPDRNLYISYGDGGGSGDDEPGHGTLGNGQNTNTILGSIVRINPLGNNSANGKYGVPVDNPLVGIVGLDEIYVYGVRNPFQFGFDVDPATGLATATAPGTFILPDVGQGNIEEVNIAHAGDNLGWRYKEGSFYFDPSQPNATAVSATPFPSIPLPFGFSPVDPVLEYDHDEGRSIVGGYIYRGSAIPELYGKYVFGDFTQGAFGSSNGRLFYGDLTTGEIQELVLGFNDRALGQFVKGIGRGPDGELYLLSGTNLGPSRDAFGNGLSGVYKFVSAVPEPSSLTALAVVASSLILRRRFRR